MNISKIFVEFLTGGYDMVQIGDDLNRVRELYGDQPEQMDFVPGGFVQYGVLRFGYQNREVDDIGFYFISDPDAIIYVETQWETFAVGYSSQLHDVIRLLNTLELDWVARGGKLTSGIQLVARDGSILLKFDDSDGNLLQIRQI